MTLAPEATWQGSLLGSLDPAIDPEFRQARRTLLDQDSWVDHVPGWLSGADALFDRLHADLEWSTSIVTMYDRRMPEPRLTASATPDGAPAAPVLADASAALTQYYGLPFDGIGACLYRDGSDSVAWHGDRVARHHRNPIVAVVSLGSARPFLLRPKGGGNSVRLVPYPGDLLVMGGASQHRWEHAVPKVASAGPRISVQFRHDVY